MVTIFVPDIPEFIPLLDAARRDKSCALLSAKRGYWRIEARDEIRFVRKELGLGPALWNTALSGGYRGRIVEYDRNVMRIVGEV